MTISPVFGRIVTGAWVADAMQATLEEWMPDYLEEIARQDGSIDPGTLAPVRSWHRAESFVKPAEKHLPACIILTQGTGDRPEKRGDGVYPAEFVVGAAILVTARDHAATRRLAELYGAAVLGAVVQHGDLGGLAAGVTWESLEYADVPDSASRTLAAAELMFTVRVENVVDAHAGPLTPSVAPESGPPDVPLTALTVEVEAEPS